MNIIRPLIDLCGNQEVKALSLFAEACGKLTQHELMNKYQTEMTNAPHREAVNQRYLIDSHQGIPSTGSFTNRNEEHLALALFNQYKPPNIELDLPDGEKLSILEYQLPLKARRSDAGVGKVDLFGIAASGQATIIELKIGKRGDTPLRALLEALAYTAIVQANIATLRREVRLAYNLTITTDVPRVIVMGPEEYWSKYRSSPSAKNWEYELQAVGDRIQKGIGVTVSFVTLKNASFVHGLNGSHPRLDGPITCDFALKRSE